MGEDQEKQKYSVYWESLGKGDHNHHIPRKIKSTGTSCQMK